MQCDDVRKQLPEYLAGSVNVTGELALLQHLETCPGCLTEFEELHKLWADLGDVPVPVFEPSELRGKIAQAIEAVHRETDSDSLPRRYEMKRMMKVVALIAVAATLATAAGLYFVRENSEVVVARADEPRPFRGLSSAPITLVEYGDYQCNPCRISAIDVKELLAKYPAMLKYEFRHFPLTKIHPRASAAAMAAQAAASQNKFWEMHDLLFQTQAQWSFAPDVYEYFAGLAEQLGMDKAMFLDSMRDHEIDLEIQQDAAAAQEAGVTAVPAYFVDGERVDLKQLEQLLRGYLERK